jgi:Restriction endonuclease
MSSYSQEAIKEYIASGQDKTLSTKARGDALEDLICYFLEELPGVRCLRNSRDPFQSQEIDVTVANAALSTWMRIFPSAILVECKNWDDRVGVNAVTDFIFKLMAKYVEVGIIVAANGITGDPAELTAAYQRIAISQTKGHRVLVITTQDLIDIATTDDFELLLNDCFLRAVGAGRF